MPQKSDESDEKSQDLFNGVELFNPFLALLSGSLILSGSLSADALYWDGGTTTQTANNAVDGGAGSWQNGLVNWTNVGGDTESAWANGSGNDAVFSGTAARVALNSAITVGNINFATPGYTIDLSRDLNSNSAGQPVYNLTASSLSGSSGTIQASSTWNTGTFTLDTPVSTTSTWSGTIGNVGTKMGFTKQGAGTFEYSGTLKTEYSNVNINGGTMKFVGAVNSSTNVFWNVNNSGTTLDLNGNTINGFRNLNTGTGTTLTSAGAVTQSWTYANTGSTLNGDITGAVKLSFEREGLTIGLGGNSSYTGGTTIAPNWKTAVNINVTSNTGMGAGPVFLDGYNNGANSSTINVNFKTAAPVIGSLANDGEGLANFVILGNTGVNTTLTVGALGTNTEFKGVIKDFTGQVGGLTKTGTGTLTLGGANTYTGDTTVSAGALTLSPSGQLRFYPGATGVSNKLTGAGTANLNGKLSIDLASAVVANGNAWTLVDVATPVYNLLPVDGVTSINPALTFTNLSGVWSATNGGNTWTLSQATGVLSLATVASSPYDTFASVIPDPVDRDPADDPDADGFSNLAEFVLGGSPIVSSQSILPTQVIDATNIVLSYKRTDASELAPATTSVGQYSTDLANWTDVTPVLLNENGTDADDMTVTVPKSNEFNGKLFVRVRFVK